MSISKLFANATLPWTLVGMGFVYIVLNFLFSGTCPAQGSKYYVSPQGDHVAHHFYESCGGATVGFTQVVDLDGVEVFNTYGGGNNNAVLKWTEDDVLQIEYPLNLYHVRGYKPKVGDVEVKLIHTGEIVTEQMIADAQDDYDY